METELLQSLEDVGYSGPLLDPSKINGALQGGAKSPDFTNLVSWLTDQIGSFGNFDETVHPTSSPDDASSFLLEISTFLKELGCTNKKLITGNVNQRLANIEERTTLLEYLITELMANKIVEANKPQDKTVEITISESITARSMREMLTALRFQKPPDNITPALLFKKLHTKVSEVIKQVPKDLVGKPLFFGELNNNQWEKLDKLQGDLNEEYTIRREMLLKRLDVTVNSFAWSERIRPKEDDLNKCYHTKRDLMKREPDVTLAHLLSARDDLAIIEKTSNASVRKNTKSSINKVIIGAVPDRGGRPCEQEPPPPEMPSWQKDRVQGPQRGGFGGGGGRGGGRGGQGGGGRGGQGGGGYGGGQGGGRGGGGGGGGYRDNKSASSNFGQNFDKPQQPVQIAGFGSTNFSFGNQVGGSTYNNQQGYSSSQSYGNKGYGNQGSSGYGGNQGSSGYSGNQSSYGGQSSGYSQGSNYSNQDSGYSNQGGYDRKSGGGGDYNKGGQGRGGRVQGGWNQGGDSGSYNKGGYNNRGQGGGRRY